MRIGVVFPQTEIGNDPAAIRDYAQAVEGMGYTWHKVPDAGINPLPVQRPIPVWMGGESEPVQRRMARMGDGWMPHFRPKPESQPIIDRLHGMIREVGRDPSTFGIEGRITLTQVPREQWASEIAAWRAMRGVTHVCINTMNLGLATADDHVKKLRDFKDVAL